MTEHEPASRSPEPRREIGWSWWAASGLMALVLIGLAVVLIWPKENNDTATADPKTSAAPVATSSVSDSPPPSTPVTPKSDDPATDWENDLGCNGTVGSTEIPLGPPRNVTWRALGALSVPASSDLGPLDVSKTPVRRCFQHSPSGALLASINILAAGGATGSWKDAAAVAREQMTAGTARDEQLASTTDTTPQSWSVAGFRAGACEPARCNLDLVISINGQLSQTTMPMVWEQGDWKLDGQYPGTVSTVTSLPGGFAPWAPGM